MTENDIFTYIVTLILHDIGHIGITNKDNIHHDICTLDDSSETDSTSTMYSYSNEDSINEMDFFKRFIPFI